MSAPDELYPPTQYGWGWLVLALGVLALLCLAAWLLIFLTRPRRTPTPEHLLQPPMPLAGEALNMLRTEYIHRIDQIEAAHRSGALSDRAANLELSRLVRTFVNEYSGLEAPVLALEDLKQLGVQPELIDAISRYYYPSIFRRDSAVDPVAGVEAARRVVASWH